MKKILSLLLALTLLCSLSVTAFADTSGDQTVTLTVPEAPSPTWTLNIPADTTVEYRAASTALATPTITNVSDLDGLIYVYIGYTGNFSSGSNTIPFTLMGHGQTILKGDESSRSVMGIYRNESGYENYYPEGAMTLDITEDAWNAAAPGTYSTVITYTSEIRYDEPIIINP